MKMDRRELIKQFAAATAATAIPATAEAIGDNDSPPLLITIKFERFLGLEETANIRDVLQALVEQIHENTGQRIPVVFLQPDSTLEIVLDPRKSNA